MTDPVTEVYFFCDFEPATFRKRLFTRCLSELFLKEFEGINLGLTGYQLWKCMRLRGHSIPIGPMLISPENALFVKFIKDALDSTKCLLAI